MNYLGIDYGEKRIGLAYGNERVACPLEVVPNNKHLVEKLDEIIKDNNVDALVVGVPRKDGKETKLTSKARGFGEFLSQKFKLPTRFVNEDFSSLDARGLAKKLGYHFNGHIDNVAAVIILQDFLDDKKHK